MKIGWERQKRRHFDEIVVNYDKIRLDYPAELFNDIFKYTKMSTKMALEIGAGTGKATASFLDNGYDVTAVEIGENMSAYLRTKFKKNKCFNVIVSDFESSLLEEEMYDLVYSATAFHWVDAKVGCPKVFSILKNGGTFALFRYNTVPADGDEIYEKIQEVYEKYFYKPYVRPIMKTYEQYKNFTEIMRGFGFEDLAEYGFYDVSIKLYPFARTFNADEFIALLDTFSDHRSLPEEDRIALYKGITEVIKKYGGYHKVNYVFQLYMGRKL